MKRKKIIILGCTGSIGKNAETAIKTCGDYFEVTAVSAHTDESNLLKFAEKFKVKNMCLTGKKASDERIKYHGEHGLIEMIKSTDAEILLNGIAGAAGLAASIATIESGKNLACANKETIVMAGELILNLAKTKGVEILPVDSEHSAIWHLIRGFKREYISEILLTASGGALRNRPIDTLKNVTVNAALAHPTWEMGPKITIDSATMANKGLEIIEAEVLFNVPPEKIKVVIHPKSYVHSLIRTIDGYLYAQVSLPDMSIPVQNALSWPEIIKTDHAALTLPEVALEFRELDLTRYPIIHSAYKAAEKKGAYPAVFNAANEEAVAAFIEGEIAFTDISNIVRDSLEFDWPLEIDSFGQLFSVDRQAREKAADIINKYRQI